jgi:hypothetical protein
MVYRDQEIGMSVIRRLRSLLERHRLARLLDDKGFRDPIGANLFEKELRHIAVEDKLADSPRTDRTLSRFTVPHVDRH